MTIATATPNANPGSPALGAADHDERSEHRPEGHEVVQAVGEAGRQDAGALEGQRDRNHPREEEGEEEIRERRMPLQSTLPSAGPRNHGARLFVAGPRGIPGDVAGGSTRRATGASLPRRGGLPG